jgi:hypothetical protein
MNGARKTSLEKQIKSDIKAAKKIWLPWWVVLCWGACCALVVWQLLVRGRFDLAVPTLNCIAVLIFVIILKRTLARHVWFWIAMAIIAALHALLVLYVPWTSKWVPALAIAAIDSADLIAIIAVLAVLARIMGKPQTDNESGS